MNKGSVSDQSILQDSFGRVHNYLRISLTERCNLRCFYCMPKEGIPLRDRSHFMSSEEIHSIAKIFTQLGVNKIRLTGGEPLVRKGADQIIQNLASLNAELGITTNGILVDRYIKVLKESGVRSINISLDSLDPDRQALISRRDYFDRIYRNIHLLLAYGFQVKINVVVMKGVNDDELIDFVELTRAKPLHVRFIEFMPFGGNEWTWDKGVGFSEIMRILRREYDTEDIIQQRERQNSTSKQFKVKGFIGDFGVISSVTNPFCGTCNRIRITADGKMKNCLFSTSEVDLLTPLRDGEDIVPLIVKSIKSKDKIRAGMGIFEDMISSDAMLESRSMVSIGG